MSRVQPETRLTGLIRDALLAAAPGLAIFKIHGSPYQTAGLPDLLVLWQGRAAWIEVKCPQPGEGERARGRVTPLQAAKQEQLREAGCPVLVALSVEEAVAFVTGWVAGLPV